MPIKQTFNLTEILNILATQRPMFHSEADFQHALAWVIHEHHPKLRVRLEYRPIMLNHKTYADIWLEDENNIYAIELKYKTRKLQVTINDESFNLLDQSAQDIARYDFCRDIGRIETLATTYPKLIGFAVLLTNDPGYWQKSKRNSTIDAAFRVHEGIKLRGKLRWSKQASAGTTNGRVEPIHLNGKYQLKWMEYSNCGKTKYSKFRMAIISTK